MNLRDLQNFVISQMTNRLTECGINVDQIEQIKIRDRQIPSNDNDDNVVWMLDTVDIDKNPIWMIYKYGGHPNYSTAVTEILRWIDAEIITCYLNDKLNRDLSIEIMGNGKGMMAI